MQVPPVAPPRRRGPMDQGTGLRSRRMQVRPLPSTRTALAVAQWTRAPPSEGGRRTFESCRRGPPQALEAQPDEHVPGTDEVVGATPTEGSTEEPNRKRPGWIRSLSRKQVRVLEAPGRSSRPASATHSPRSSSGQDAGPSTRRPGFDSPSRYAIADARWSSGTDVRLLPGRREFDPLAGSALARWPRIQARGCRPRHGGESPSRASISIRGRRPTDKDPGPPRRR